MKSSWYRLVFGAVRDALAGKNMIPDAVLSESRREKRVYAASPEPFECNRLTMSRDALRQQASQVRERAIEATLRAELFAGDGPEPEKRANGETARAGESTAETAQGPAGAGMPEHGGAGMLKPVSETDTAGYRRTEADNSPERVESGIPESGQKSESGQETAQTGGIPEAAPEKTGQVPDQTPETPAGKAASLVREECAYSAEIPNGKAPEPEQPQQLSLFEAAERTKEAFLKKESSDRCRIIGQLFATYWLVEFEEQLFIIDQHAAHEKILYERTVRRMKEKAGQSGLSQLLAPPEILSLSIREAEVLRRYQAHFEALGFEIEEFGGREYSVRAVPVELYGADGRALLTELLDTLLDEPPGGAPDMILDRIAAMSCKAAVKGNMTLSEPEARAMLNELLLLENPFHCPHGRPIIISMTKHEIEKKFKRIVN